MITYAAKASLKVPFVKFGDDFNDPNKTSMTPLILPSRMRTLYFQVGQLNFSQTTQFVVCTAMVS